MDWRMPGRRLGLGRSQFRTDALAAAAPAASTSRKGSGSAKPLAEARSAVQ